MVAVYLGLSPKTQGRPAIAPGFGARPASINPPINKSVQDEYAVDLTPSKWARVRGILDMVFPAWMVGRPITTSQGRFSAGWAYGFMVRLRVSRVSSR